MSKEGLKNFDSQSAIFHSAKDARGGAHLVYQRPKAASSPLLSNDSGVNPDPALTNRRFSTAAFNAYNPQSGVAALTERSSDSQAEVETSLPSAAQRLYDLAAKYVDVFQNQGAASLSPKQRHAMIAEVAMFYSAPSRAGRLEALVSAFGD